MENSRNLLLESFSVVRLSQFFSQHLYHIARWALANKEHIERPSIDYASSLSLSIFLIEITQTPCTKWPQYGCKLPEPPWTVGQQSNSIGVDTAICRDPSRSSRRTSYFVQGAKSRHWPSSVVPSRHRLLPWPRSPVVARILLVQGYLYSKLTASISHQDVSESSTSNRICPCLALAWVSAGCIDPVSTAPTSQFPTACSSTVMRPTILGMISRYNEIHKCLASVLVVGRWMQLARHRNA
eukprot:scaffold7995_cov173-Amphora_coffeaeformis.AAC.7